MVRFNLMYTGAMAQPTLEDSEVINVDLDKVKVLQKKVDKQDQQLANLLYGERRVIQRMIAHMEQIRSPGCTNLYEVERGGKIYHYNGQQLLIGGKCNHGSYFGEQLPPVFRWPYSVNYFGQMRQIVDRLENQDPALWEKAWKECGYEGDASWENVIRLTHTKVRELASKVPDPKQLPSKRGRGAPAKQPSEPKKKARAAHQQPPASTSSTKVGSHCHA